MKHIFAYTLSLVAIAAAALMFTKASRAEDDPETPEILNRYKPGGGVSTAKEVSSQNEDGSYTITLETFATGDSDLEIKSVPSDVILILDLSSSMGNNYSGGQTRIQALKQAVIGFAGSIFENAEKARETDPDFVNRIAIIGYNRNAIMYQSWLSVDNTVIHKSGNTYAGSLVNTINNMEQSTGTRPDHGLHMAIDMLLDGTPNKKRDEANLTVLLFTDGYPTDNNASNWGEPTNTGDTDKFENSFANKTLYYGNIVKKTYSATLYTVGLITTPSKPGNTMRYYYEPNPGGNNTNTWRTAYRWRNYCRVLQMMDWLSSNYPDAKWKDGVVDPSKLAIESPSNATQPEGATDYKYYAGFSTSTNVPGTYNNVFRGEENIDSPWKNVWTYAAEGDAVTLTDFVPGETESDDNKFTWDKGYFKIIDEDTSFDGVFKEIADASGGAAAEIAATTQVRDVVSSSFVLPEGAASDLSKINLKIFTYDIADDASEWINETQLYPVTSGTPTVTPSVIKTEDGHDALYVEGFYYSKDDVPENSGNGNWVGVRYRGEEPYYAGKKLVIKFDIQANESATGGQGTATNTSDSGVWIKNEDGSYTNINSYEVPHTTLPVNIIIQKTGLRHGESATFEIHQAPILMVDGKVQYNALGKPKPDEDHWNVNFSKVIITNKGTDGAAVTKTLLSLDPGYVYRVAEDKWGWAYKMTGQGGVLTTAEVEVNPFTFKNEEQADKPKHAEAVTINHFATPAQGSYEEHYKSSKVETFD